MLEIIFLFVGGFVGYGIGCSAGSDFFERARTYYKLIKEFLTIKQ
jgi:hypothetical protein